MRLTFDSVTAGYHRKAVVFDASFSLAAGEILCLLGANGCGKTTLLKTALGLIRPLKGTVHIEGEDIALWPRARMARALGYVPQAHTPPFAFRVRDVVLMARLIHNGVFAAPQARDYAIADEALDRLNMRAFADVLYTELSGGERQLVLIARALAQQARLLVLDEPTSNLDFSNQVRVLQHIRELAAAGIGAIVTTHYPDFAFWVATGAVLMKQGRIMATGSVEETLTEVALQEAYGTPV